jgi:hypothetical protein
MPIELSHLVQLGSNLVANRQVWLKVCFVGYILYALVFTCR